MVQALLASSCVQRPYHGIAFEEDRQDLYPPGTWTLKSRRSSAYREQPQGASHHVNPYQVADMQSAINELGAIAVSAAIHDERRNAIVMQRGEAEMQLDVGL